MGRQIYLDNSATTKISDVALKKYIEISENYYGNPSSLHGMGVSCEKYIEEARHELLKSVGGEKEYTAIFTSCGSESNNLAITGRAFAKERFKNGGKIITTEGEHASVSEPVKNLQKQGFKVSFIPTRNGEIDFSALESELTDDVILLSFMMVNNETGALYNIPKVSNMMKSKCKQAVLHVDATQSYMKVPFLMNVIGADMLTVSSHKIEGPKGVGALVISRELIKNKGLSPIILGGGQEGGLRSGTENVPGICAFGASIKENSSHLKENIEKMQRLRSYLLDRLSSELKEIKPVTPKYFAPHILNITLPNIKSETMLHFLSSEGIFVSSGSACSSNTNHLSSALIAYGKTPAEADSSIRISFSHKNEFSDVDALIESLKKGLVKLSRIKN